VFGDDPGVGSDTLHLHGEPDTEEDVTITPDAFNADEQDITVFRVPGAWEIPMVASKLASVGGYDGIICVGALVRGGTAHFDLIAAEVAKGIASSAMESGVPISFGVITTDTLEQAVERAGTKMGNKGWEAALAAIEMARLYRGIDGGP
jgi:6,7-dimethyl-8-ribityllumazine synthase